MRLSTSAQEGGYKERGAHAPLFVFQTTCSPDTNAHRAATAGGVKARLRPEGHGLDASAGRAMMGGSRLDSPVHRGEINNSRCGCAQRFRLLDRLNRAAYSKNVMKSA